MDTSILQFYPTLFVLAMDIMDMLGDMVWERIMWKAEFAENGTRLCSLPGLSSFCISLSLFFFFIVMQWDLCILRIGNIKAGHV